MNEETNLNGFKTATTPFTKEPPKSFSQIPKSVEQAQDMRMGGLLGEKPQTDTIAGLAQQLMQNATETARRRARGLMPNGGGMQVAQPQITAPQTPANGSLANEIVRALTGGSAAMPQNTPSASPATPMPQPQPINGLNIDPSSGIGSYDYNGIQVTMPSDIDINDSAAVDTYRNEANELIDMMNETTNEEEF